MEAMLGKMEEEKGRRKTRYIVAANGEGKVRGQRTMKKEGDREKSREESVGIEKRERRGGGGEEQNRGEREGR